MKDIKIKDVALVTNVTGDEKIPVSNGSGKPAAVTINQILEKVPATDLSDYATNDSVDLKIADLIGGAPETLDTLKELSDALADNSDVLELLDNKVDRSELENQLSNVYTKEEVDSLENNKADKSEIPTKVSDLENDSEFITGEALNQFQDTIMGGPILAINNNLSNNYYTKTEIDNMIISTLNTEV